MQNSPLGKALNALTFPQSQSASRTKLMPAARPRGRNNNNNNNQMQRSNRGMVLYRSPNSTPSGFLNQGLRNQITLPRDQLGSVVRTRLTRLGLADIKSHRVTWVIGYTYVGNGTNGAANAVYFVDATQSHLLLGYVAGNNSGLCPILGSDANLGASYVSDIDKHYARKRVKRMWLHIDSLQPSTSNNMMCVVAPRRGFGTTFTGDFSTTLASTVAANTVPNVTSMRDAITVDSFESKCLDLTSYIAGGSGSAQNEFEISQLGGFTAVAGHTCDLDGVAPAGFAVAGNSTTTALQGTYVHQISVEQEVDLLDFVGGLAQVLPFA